MKLSDRIKFDLPTFRDGQKFRYEVSSTKMCLVYPIFCLFPGEVSKWHINSAFWSANSFIENSNIVDKGIPIYFYLSIEEIVDKCSFQFISANIPMNRQLHFRAPHRKHPGAWFMPKLLPLFERRFAHFDNIIMPDVDFYLAKRPGVPKMDIMRFANRVNPEMPGYIYVWNKPERELKHHNYTERQRPDTTWRDWVQENYDKKLKNVHKIRGYLSAFSPKRLDPNFKEFVTDAFNEFGDDEAVASIYSQIYDKKIEALHKTWNFQVAETGREMHEFADKMHHFGLHIQRSALDGQSPRKEVLDKYFELAGIYGK